MNGVRVFLSELDEMRSFFVAHFCNSHGYLLAKPVTCRLSSVCISFGFFMIMAQWYDGTMKRQLLLAPAQTTDDNRITTLCLVRWTVIADI